MDVVEELRAFLAGHPQTGEVDEGAVNPLINRVGDLLAEKVGVPYRDILAHIEQLTDDELYKLAWSCEQYHASREGAEYAFAATMVAISCAVEFANRLADKKG